MSTPPPPGTKTSSSGTGEQTSEFTLGHGMYQLWAASVKSSLSYAMAARIAYIYKTGDGTEVEVNLVSGMCTAAIPLCLPNSVILQGPGKLRSVCQHLETTTHTFNAEYRKIDPTQLVGVVR